MRLFLSIVIVFSLFAAGLNATRHTLGMSPSHDHMESHATMDCCPAQSHTDGKAGGTCQDCYVPVMGLAVSFVQIAAVFKTNVMAQGPEAPPESLAYGFFRPPSFS